MLEVVTILIAAALLIYALHTLAPEWRLVRERWRGQTTRDDDSRHRPTRPENDAMAPPTNTSAIGAARAADVTSSITTRSMRAPAPRAQSLPTIPAATLTAAVIVLGAPRSLCSV
jgi:hypothetical protein